MTVGVIGLGYVGLPSAVEFAEAGEQLVVVDIDERKIAAIEAGESYIEDISSERLQAALGSIEPWSHFAPLARTDAVLICVPTLLTPNREELLPLLERCGPSSSSLPARSTSRCPITASSESSRRSTMPRCRSRGRGS